MPRQPLKPLTEFAGNNIVNTLVEHPEFEGQAYYYRAERQCRICSADDNRALDGLGNEGFCEFVDRLILKHGNICKVGRLIAPLIATWPEQHRPNLSSLYVHSRRHLSRARSEALRLVHDDMADRGESIHESKQQFVTNKLILKNLLLEGWRKVVDGEIVVEDVPQLLLVARYLDQMEAIEGSAQSVAALRADVSYLLEAVRRVVPQEMWTDIQREFDQMKRLELGSGTSNDDDFDAIEAEIIEQDQREWAER